MLMSKIFSAILVAGLTACGGGGGGENITKKETSSVTASLITNSLEDLTIEGLRSRDYGSKLGIEERRSFRYGKTALFASYKSDGLKNYARIDIPTTAMPEGGYPIVIFGHGWIGEAAAPGWNFGASDTSMYGDMVDSYRERGFVVVSPGYRGHGTVNGVAAEGIEFLKSYDNGSYLSSMFYAIDILNLLEGINSLDEISWDKWNENKNLKFNYRNINLVAHSQGGDAALAALAVSGKGGTTNKFAHASIWSGTFPDRLTQVNTYNAMASSAEAFLAGDGTYTGTAVGKDGTVNPNFVFGFPPNWIGVADPSQWGVNNTNTWQKAYFSTTYEAAVKKEYDEMHATFNKSVKNLATASYVLNVENNGKVVVTLDEKIKKTLLRIGGFNYQQYLDQPINLQFSDRDYYSFPAWDYDLANRINTAGGKAYTFEYKGNSHSLKATNEDWFTPVGTISGFDYANKIFTAIERDAVLFNVK